MSKFWIVYREKNTGNFTRHDSKLEAIVAAKRMAHNDRDNIYVVMEAVAFAQSPVPDIEVVDL